MEPVKKPRRSKPAVRVEGGSALAEDAADATQPVDLQGSVKAPALSPAAAAAAASDLADAMADEDAALLLRQPEAPRNTALSVHLSHQLHSKLMRTARDEGVSLEALVQELLAEGVTLRAWEIIERKSAMRGQAAGAPSPGNANNRNFNNSYGNNRHGNNNNRGGVGNGPMNGNRGQPPRGAPSRNAPANNAWMEDKAAFLEYVRNQEKRRR